jgi:hypothetical protein
MELDFIGMLKVIIRESGMAKSWFYTFGFIGYMYKCSCSKAVV